MGQQQRLLILNLSLKAATVLCLAGGNPRPVTTKTTTSVSNGFNLQPLSLHFSRLGTAASHTIPGLSQSAIIDGNPSFVQEEVTTTTQHLLATSSGENSLLLNPALPKDSTGVMVMTQPMYHPPPPHDEPSTWAKITRRMRVFLLAGRIFASYKTTKLQESFLRRRLGLSKENQNVDNNNDDHPAIVQLWDRAHERNANRILHAVEHLQGFLDQSWTIFELSCRCHADPIPTNAVFVTRWCTRKTISRNPTNIVRTIFDSFLTIIRFYRSESVIHCIHRTSPSSHTGRWTESGHQGTTSRGGILNVTRYGKFANHFAVIGNL